MIKKFQLYINIVIILMVIIGIIYFIVVSGIKVFTPGEKLYLKDIKPSLTSDKLITDYSEYYSASTALSNFTQACMDEKYTELYSIMDSKYKKAYSLEETKAKLKEYNDNHFKTIDTHDRYVSYSNLKNIYFYNDIYILFFTDAKAQDMYIAIKRNYKENKYTFAFVEE